MTNASKGAFLSGLVLPGLGQVVLKHYKRGIVLMVTVLVGTAGIVVIAVQKALTVLEKIESEGGIMDMNTISNAASEASTPSGSLTIKILFLSIIICWIYGTFDAYRIGKKKDLGEQL